MNDVLEGPFGESAGGQGWAALLLLLAVVLAYFVIRWVAERYYAWHDRRHPWVPTALNEEGKAPSSLERVTPGALEPSPPPPLTSQDTKAPSK